jgi:hypothetical protein
MLITACPSCGSKLGYTPENVGKNTRCPTCATVFVIAPPPPPPPPAPPPPPPPVEPVKAVELVPEESPVLLTPDPEEPPRPKRDKPKREEPESSNPFAMDDDDDEEEEERPRRKRDKKKRAQPQSGNPFATGDEEDELDDDELEYEKTLRQRRYAACSWISTAGWAYYVLAMLYVLRGTCMCLSGPQGSGEYLMGVLMGSVAAIAFSLALGYYLHSASAFALRGAKTSRDWHDNYQGTSRRQKLKTAGVMAIVFGCLALLGGLAFLGTGITRMVAVMRGAEFADKATMPIALALSIIGGSKAAGTIE